jgi:hypothetical protein
VVKAPRALPGVQDAVEVEAPDLVGTLDPTVSVRVEFLELPITEPPERCRDAVQLAAAANVGTCK